MNTLITICARGGSKGIPGKNIKELNGKPVIAYTIEFAQKYAEKHGAVVGLSTDSEEIKHVAAQYGLITEYLRPQELGNDTVGKIPVITALMDFQEKKHQKSFDYVIDLDITSPLRTIKDIEEAMQKLESQPDAYNIFSVNHANRNPYFNMVEENPNGFVTVVKNTGAIFSRQEAPAVYDMNASFYIFRKNFFKDRVPTTTSPKSLAYVMNHICFDLDEPIDLSLIHI